MKNLMLLITCVVLVVVSMSISARERGRGKPEFVTACSSLSEGEACTFTNRQGETISDTCKSITNPRGEAELACGNPPPRPERKRERRGLRGSSVFDSQSTGGRISQE